MPKPRRRIDAVLVDRGLATSRGEARELIESGRVTVDGAPAWKPTRQVAAGQAIEVLGPPRRWVGRGAEKLLTALDAFSCDPAERRCLDAGSSTGGFTDVLVQRGAAEVVAVDVGTNQLHERLRRHTSVTSLEQTDIRSDVIDDLAPFSLIVADLSFISTIGLLPRFSSLLADSGDLIVLVKPQFEAGRQAVSKGRGIVRDPSVWIEVLHSLIDRAPDAGLAVEDLAISPIRGGKGNVEFLAHLRQADILEV